MSLDDELIDHLNSFWIQFDSILNPDMPPYDTPDKDKVKVVLPQGQVDVSGHFFSNFNRQSRSLDFQKFKDTIVRLDINSIIHDLADV